MSIETDYVTDVVTSFTTIWVTSGFVAPDAATSSINTAPHSIVAEFYQSASISSAVSTLAAISSAVSTSTAVPSSATPVAPVSTIAALKNEEKAVVPDDQNSAPATSSASVAQPTADTASSTSVAQPTADTSSDGLDYGFPKPSGSQDLSTQCSAGSPCNGKLTHYTLSDAMACGYPGLAGGDNTFRVMALPHELMGLSSNENGGGVVKPVNANCDRVVEISCTDTGKKTTAIVVDKCMGCENTNIDLSPAVFTALGITADTAQAVWNFIS